ncbi:hypothetical protein CDD83_2964 [Cordyceps sp. RAO-2017]|nr:hypothetical protein CDD83_2964 [Cordyceps sp. RAO-2017]
MPTYFLSPVESNLPIFLLNEEYVANRFEIAEGSRDGPGGQSSSNKRRAKVLGSDGGESGRPSQWVKAVEDFLIRNAGDLDPDEDQEGAEIKVCLIDDGVTNVGGEFSGNICAGWPEGDPWTGEEPFYNSASGHGTTMARLISSVCPNVKLYVAKLGEWREDQERISDLQKPSVARKAAEAVEWAIEHKVHVISMSWSLVKSEANERDVEKLGDQINAAGGSANKMLLYCSANDEGMYGSHKSLYPCGSDTKAIKTIGSATPQGNVSDQVNKDKVDHLFPGGLEEAGSCGGSSAATARAAGLAALILSCYAKRYGRGGVQKIAGWDKMSKIFKGMEATSSKWIDVTALLRPDSTVESVVGQCESWLSAYV